MAKHMAVRREENGIEGTNFIVTERCLDLVKKACFQSMLLKWWRQISHVTGDIPKSTKKKIIAEVMPIYFLNFILKSSLTTL